MFKIINMTNDKEYIATCEKDCKTQTELSAYKSAVQMNETICMGCILVVPKRFWNKK